MDVRVARFVRLAIGLTALFAFPSAPWAAEASCTSLQPAAAERGTTVRVTVPNTQAQRADVRLRSQFQALVEPPPIQAQVVGGVVTFVVPSLPLGDYLIDVTTDAATDNRCQSRFQITPLPLKVRGVTIADDNLTAPTGVVRATAADSDDPPAPPILYLTTPYQRGADVKLVQEALNGRSFANGRDGVFGPFTEALVKMFQRAQGLVVDGVVGPATRRALGL